MRFDLKIKLRSLVLNFSVILLALLLNCNVLYMIVLVLWINMLLYSINDLKNRSMLFAFLVAFFVFLMGREFLEQFFFYKVEIFEEPILNHTYLSLLLSLSSIAVGYGLFNKYGFKKIIKNGTQTLVCNVAVKKVSKCVYYGTWFFAVASKATVSLFISSNSYWDYYTGYSEYLVGNLPLYLISKIELIMPVALSIYAASLPTKAEFKSPGIFYIFYLLVSLGTGQRSTFVLGVLFIVVYFLFRQGTNPEEQWVKRSYITIGILSIPLLAVFLSAYSYWRTGAKLTEFTFISGFADFLYDQGVSSNIIKRAYMYQENIPNQIYVLEFVHSGILARIFGIPVYQGNTIEHALYGGSFTHSLGYVVLGSSYLAGRGTGSSYIAELFHDFGYIGIIIGSLFYSYLIARINRKEIKQNTFTMSVRFYIITQILWAPRGSFTGFISNLLAPSSIICFAFVFGVAALIKSKYAAQPTCSQGKRTEALDV